MKLVRDVPELNHLGHVNSLSACGSHGNAERTAKGVRLGGDGVRMNPEDEDTSVDPYQQPDLLLGSGCHKNLADRAKYR